MCRKVYKFQDLKDFETAFIVSDSRFDAIQKMKTETKIPFELVDELPADEIPSASRKPLGTHIIKNNIDLF